jgi:hypothetical protein
MRVAFPYEDGGASSHAPPRRRHYDLFEMKKGATADFANFNRSVPA